MQKPDILNNALVRYCYLKMIRHEFGIHIADDDIETVKHLEDCIQIFDSWEAFYRETGWDRDNPECADCEYLIKQRICREIGDEVWYFSRLKWDRKPKRVDILLFIS